VQTTNYNFILCAGHSIAVHLLLRRTLPLKNTKAQLENDLLNVM